MVLEMVIKNKVCVDGGEPSEFAIMSLKCVILYEIILKFEKNN